jgi:hypothetical protein
MTNIIIRYKVTILWFITCLLIMAAEKETFYNSDCANM